LADCFFEIGLFSERNSNIQFIFPNSSQKNSNLNLKCAALFFPRKNMKKKEQQIISFFGQGK